MFTPLLEGISYLSANGPQFQQLVITDFGCCSADRRYGLQQPYRTWDTDRGGNASLMAPEIATARPGSFSTLNYERFVLVYKCRRKKINVEEIVLYDVLVMY